MSDNTNKQKKERMKEKIRSHLLKKKKIRILNNSRLFNWKIGWKKRAAQQKENAPSEQKRAEIRRRW